MTPIWTTGRPTASDVLAHKQHGGLWLVVGPGDDDDEPAFAPGFVTLEADSDGVSFLSWPSDVFMAPPTESKRWGLFRFTPVDEDGVPVRWD